MTDPLSLTAATIATLAFQKFIESGAGELAKKFTTEAITQMDTLRQRIVTRLQGKSKKLDEALVKAEEGDKAAVEAIGKNLDVVMDESPEFAEEIRVIAREITLNQIQDNSSISQTNYGGTNYQTKTGPDNTNFFGGTHTHGSK
ncbi:hypothetical protein [Nodosilinea sp. E11]|uniref:hypothetical protein n=1 Tax=Nodosilinea sp. E11 TaxID=3037479 RepID=UPI0029350B9C|nr:hypothetical protein [Nodosilinea sp. E11]WOD39911.1 hypothetical protein RRF56_03795 [Nodosilinea sp. E11]